MEPFGTMPGGKKRYGVLLRPIGAYLDSIGARYISIAEIEEGFIWHCLRNHSPMHAMSGGFTHEEIPQLIESIKLSKAERRRALEEEALRARRGAFGLFRRQTRELEPIPDPHPVFRAGYEETLRSLGSKLEDQRAYQVLLVERESCLLVKYSLPLPTYIRLEPTKVEVYTGFHEIEYSAADLIGFVAEVRSRRGIAYYQG